MRATRTASETEIETILEVAKGIVPSLQATLGGTTEVVVHDFRDPARSVVAIAGNVTARSVGSPMSDMLLTSISKGASEDLLNNVMRLSDGRVIKSSIMLLRTGDGEAVGAFCVSIDITNLRLMERAFREFTSGSDNDEDDLLVTFSRDIETVMDSILADIEATVRKPLTRLPREDWMTVFRMLDERGIFRIRGAVSMLAQRFGLSRATVYNYIARLHEESANDESSTKDVTAG